MVENWGSFCSLGKLKSEARQVKPVSLLLTRLADQLHSCCSAEQCWPTHAALSAELLGSSKASAAVQLQHQ